jgi:hypothetical protein
MDFPKLQTGQYAVIAAEVDTGIILQLDRQRRLGNNGAAWQVFDSLAAAREFANAEAAKNPSVEFGIYDEHQKPIQIFRHC